MQRYPLFTDFPNPHLSIQTRPSGRYDQVVGLMAVRNGSHRRLSNRLSINMKWSAISNTGMRLNYYRY